MSRVTDTMLVGDLHDQGGLASDTLVYRYNTEAAKDGITGGEGTFNMVCPSHCNVERGSTSRLRWFV